MAAIGRHTPAGSRVSNRCDDLAFLLCFLNLKGFELHYAICILTLLLNQNKLAFFNFHHSVVMTFEYEHFLYLFNKNLVIFNYSHSHCMNTT